MGENDMEFEDYESWMLKVALAIELYQLRRFK